MRLTCRHEGTCERIEHEEAFAQLEESDDQDKAKEDNLDETETADKDCNIDFFSIVEEALEGALKPKFYWFIVFETKFVFLK